MTSPTRTRSLLSASNTTRARSSRSSTCRATSGFAKYCSSKPAQVGIELAALEAAADHLEAVVARAEELGLGHAMAPVGRVELLDAGAQRPLRGEAGQRA